MGWTVSITFRKFGLTPLEVEPGAEARGSWHNSPREEWRGERAARVRALPGEGAEAATVHLLLQL